MNAGEMHVIVHVFVVEILKVFQREGHSLEDCLVEQTNKNNVYCV